MGKLGWKHVLYSLLIVIWFLALILYIKEITARPSSSDVTLVWTKETLETGPGATEAPGKEAAG